MSLSRAEPQNTIIPLGEFSSKAYFRWISIGCFLAAILASSETFLWKGGDEFNRNSLTGTALLFVAGLVLGQFSARGLRLVLPGLTELQVNQVALAWLWPNATIVFYSLWVLVGNQGRSPVALLTSFGRIDPFPANLLLLLAGACAGGLAAAKALKPYVRLQPAIVCGFWLLGYCGAALIVRENFDFSTHQELFEHLFLENIPLFVLPGLIINLLMARYILHSQPVLQDAASQGGTLPRSMPPSPETSRERKLQRILDAHGLPCGAILATGGVIAARAGDFAAFASQGLVTGLLGPNVSPAATYRHVRDPAQLKPMIWGQGHEFALLDLAGDLVIVVFGRDRGEVRALYDLSLQVSRSIAAEFPGQPT